MKKYIVEVWFRYMVGDEQEKDFNVFEVEAESEAQAKRLACNKHKRGIIFKTEIL